MTNTIEAITPTSILNIDNKVERLNFACKVSNDLQYDRHKNNYTERYKLEKVFVLSEEDYIYFRTNMLSDYDFLSGMGGTYSTTADTKLHNKPFWEWDEDARKIFNAGAYRKCVGIITATARTMIVVDPQGYNYARYVAFN